LSILLALISFSSAFSPNNAPYIGIEPVLRRNLTPHRQQQLRESLAWQSFEMEHPTWQARFDQFTGRPYRAWGAGVPFTNNEAELENQLRQWLAQWPQLTGVKDSALRLRDLALNETETGSSWLVFFEQIQVLARPIENDLAGD